MNLQIDWSIKVGDLLTSATIIVSVVAMLLSLAKDRAARALEQANRVRSAAAAALSKLDRWQALQLSLYQELQPAYVELSEELGKKFDVDYVRDQFWKRVNTERTTIAQKVVEEQLGTAYADLISHFPAAREKFTDAYAKLNDLEVKVTHDYLAESETEIIRLDGMQKTYTTPVLGNALRRVADSHRRDIKVQSESVIAPVREYLFKVIALPDAQIIRASRGKHAANPPIELTDTALSHGPRRSSV
jgi:ABC-type transporter MlaC component